MLLTLASSPTTKALAVILCSAQRHGSKVNEAQPSAPPVARHRVMGLQRSEEEGSKQLSAPARPATAGDKSQSAGTKLSSVDSNESVLAVIWALQTAGYHMADSADRRVERDMYLQMREESELA